MQAECLTRTQEYPTTGRAVTVRRRFTVQRTDPASGRAPPACRGLRAASPNHERRAPPAPRPEPGAAGCAATGRGWGGLGPARGAGAWGRGVFLVRAVVTESMVLSSTFAGCAPAPRAVACTRRRVAPPEDGPSQRRPCLATTCLGGTVDRITQLLVCTASSQ
jgi:hypothetical protein